MKLAPIILFVYNRPHHTFATLKSLQQNHLSQQSHLYIFADGPQTDASAETLSAISEVRNIIRKENWCGEITIEERDSNLGLFKSITTGVSQLLETNERVIVLEDDLLTSPHFLSYMNDGLEFYKDEEKVICISGYTFPVRGKMPEIYFLRSAECWGWGTWKRGWDFFSLNGKELMDLIEKSGEANTFDLDGSVEYTTMLKEQIAQKNNSWCILWYASLFVNDKLCLYPGQTLVENHGFDGSGIHCPPSDAYDAPPSLNPVEVKSIPITENKAVRRKIATFFHEKESGSRLNFMVKKYLPDYLHPFLRKWNSYFRKLAS
ncbi:MAG TPA: glycosyltransferase family 2 protein [Bacteroidia bacterium]|nr:glycosyltransferase family 2 protein [Bacteroidia bacterium]